MKLHERLRACKGSSEYEALLVEVKAMENKLDQVRELAEVQAADVPAVSFAGWIEMSHAVLKILNTGGGGGVDETPAIAQ